MKQQCKICEKIFDYCNHCVIIKNPFKNAGYCDEDCYHISMILQKYISKHSTTAETADALRLHNINSKILKPEIKNYYKDIFQLIKTEEFVPQEDVEVVINSDEDMTISANE